MLRQKIFIEGRRVKISKYSNLVNSRLVEKIEDYIANNHLRPGDRLPPEREFCEVLCVSRVTLRQAVRKLCEAGKVKNIQGKGTFLAEERIVRSLMEVESPEEDTYKLIGIQKLSAQGTAGVKLKLSARNEVYQIKRIRLSRGERISIETSYIPTSHLKALDFGLLEKKSMYAFYHGQKKEMSAKKDIHISIGRSSFEESEWLEIKEGTPVAVEKHVIYQNGSPVEYLVSVSNIDKIKYAAVLGR